MSRSVLCRQSSDRLSLPDAGLSVSDWRLWQSAGNVLSAPEGAGRPGGLVLGVYRDVHIALYFESIVCRWFEWALFADVGEGDVRI